MKKSICVNGIKKELVVSSESVCKANIVHNFIENLNEPVFSNEPSFNLNAKQLKEMHDNSGSNNLMEHYFLESLQVAEDMVRDDCGLVGDLSIMKGNLYTVGIMDKMIDSLH